MAERQAAEEGTFLRVSRARYVVRRFSLVERNHEIQAFTPIADWLSG
jgi:hypothetical protein